VQNTGVAKPHARTSLRDQSIETGDTEVIRTLLINVHSCVCKHVAQIRLFDQLYRRVLKLLREASSHLASCRHTSTTCSPRRPSKLRVRSCRLLAHNLEEVIVPEIAVRATATCTCLRVLPSMGRGRAFRTTPEQSQICLRTVRW
jgi:hypothetical protein